MAGNDGDIPKTGPARLVVQGPSCGEITADQEKIGRLIREFEAIPSEKDVAELRKLEALLRADFEKICSPSRFPPLSRSLNLKRDIQKIEARVEMPRRFKDFCDALTGLDPRSVQGGFKAALEQKALKTLHDIQGQSPEKSLPMISQFLADNEPWLGMPYTWTRQSPTNPADKVHKALAALNMFKDALKNTDDLDKPTPMCPLPR